MSGAEVSRLRIDAGEIVGRPRVEWPGENGVPGNHVTGCPNFPECMCTALCMGARVEAARRARERAAGIVAAVLVAAILAGLAAGIWLVAS